MNEQEQNIQTDEISASVEDRNEAVETEPNEQIDFINNPKISAYIDLKIQEGIQKALQGTAPKVSTADPSDREKKNFEKMTYKERLNLFRSNPQAYNKLTKGIN